MRLSERLGIIVVFILGTTFLFEIPSYAQSGVVSFVRKRGIDPCSKSKIPFFIILPGIMGSKIYRCMDKGCLNKKIIWGDPNLSTDISIKSNAKYETEILDTIRLKTGFGRIRVKNLEMYKSIIDSMDIFASRCGKSYGHAFFSYDWRQDIKDIAKDFHADFFSEKGRIRKGITKGRDVIIIAHSMGGLVAEYWLREYFLKNRKKYDNHLTLKEIMYLGVPFGGSTAALLSLIHGYCNSSLRKTVKSKVYAAVCKYYMGQYDKKVFSFKSVYQLLPFEDIVRTGSKINKCPQIRYGYVSHWKSDVWEDSNWPYYGTKKNILQVNLEEGRKFQEFIISNLRTEVKNVRRRFFYGNKGNSTPTLLWRAKLPGGKYLTKICNFGNVEGDGRVDRLSASTVKWPGKSVPLTNVIGDRYHDDLFASNSFKSIIEDVLESYQRNYNENSARMIINDPIIKTIWSKKGHIIPSFSFARNVEPTKVINIDQLNSDVAELKYKNLMPSDQRSFPSYLYSLGKKEKDSNIRESIFKTMLAATKRFKSERRYWALFREGVKKLKAKKSEQAEILFHRALSEKVPSAKGRTSAEQIGITYENLALAQEQIWKLIPVDDARRIKLTETIIDNFKTAAESSVDGNPKALFGYGRWLEEIGRTNEAIDKYIKAKDWDRLVKPKWGISVGVHKQIVFGANDRMMRIERR